MKNRNFKSKSGVSALEYALIAAIIAGVGATGAAFVGGEASSIFNRVAVVVNEGQTLPDTFAGTMSPSSISLEENGSINQTLTTSGGTAPYTYSLESGSLPNGITLTGNTLSGTVTGTGSYNFTIRATDSDGSIFDQTFSGTVSGDTTPDAFTFTDQTDVATSSLITSNAITVSGLTAASSVSVSGDGSPQVSINGGAFNTSGTVSNGDTVAVRLTSSASFSTTSTATVDIGGITDAFSATTLAADTTPDAFSFTDQTNVATNTLIASNSITINGINSPAAVSVSGGGSPQININGSGWVSSGTITNGQTLQVRLTSSASFSTAQTATVTVGGVPDSFSVTTLNDPFPCSGSPSPGTTCADGSIYAGLSPDGNVPMFTTPADAPSRLAWSNSETYRGTTSLTTGETNTGTLAAFGASAHPAAHYCASLSAHGHSDWYLPAQNELNVLYNNRVAIGGFNTSGSFPAGWYWSSSENTFNLARLQRFSDGNQYSDPKYSGLAVRCVRR